MATTLAHQYQFALSVRPEIWGLDATTRSATESAQRMAVDLGEIFPQVEFVLRNDGTTGQLHEFTYSEEGEAVRDKMESEILLWIEANWDRFA